MINIPDHHLCCPMTINYDIKMQRLHLDTFEVSVDVIFNIFPVFSLNDGYLQLGLFQPIFKLS